MNVSNFGSHRPENVWHALTRESLFRVLMWAADTWPFCYGSCDFHVKGAEEQVQKEVYWGLGTYRYIWQESLFYVCQAFLETGKITSQWPKRKPLTEYSGRRWRTSLQSCSHGNNAQRGLELTEINICSPACVHEKDWWQLHKTCYFILEL